MILGIAIRDGPLTQAGPNRALRPSQSLQELTADLPVAGEAFDVVSDNRYIYTAGAITRHCPSISGTVLRTSRRTQNRTSSLSSGRESKRRPLRD